MAQECSVEQILRPVFEVSKAPEKRFTSGGQETQEDLSLCFLCMRWAAGDPDCRSGHRCDLQLVLDKLDRA